MAVISNGPFKQIRYIRKWFQSAMHYAFRKNSTWHQLKWVPNLMLFKLHQRANSYLFFSKLQKQQLKNLLVIDKFDKVIVSSSFPTVEKSQFPRNSMSNSEGKQPLIRVVNHWNNIAILMKELMSTASLYLKELHHWS